MNYIPPTGEVFVRPEFNLIWPVILYIILHHFNTRLTLFTWLIAVLPYFYICYGTIERIHIICNKTWDPATVENYLILALASWIACIITDGTYAINLYNDILKQRLHMQYQILSWALLEMSGLIVTIVVMLQYGFDVYDNFHPLTSDIWLHIYFFAAAIAKNGKIFIQGTVLLTNSDYLREQPTLTAQLLITNILAMVQDLFLFGFAPEQKWSMCILLVVDILNRLYQCYKLVQEEEPQQEGQPQRAGIVAKLRLMRLHFLDTFGGIHRRLFHRNQVLELEQDHPQPEPEQEPELQNEAMEETAQHNQSCECKFMCQGTVDQHIGLRGPIQYFIKPFEAKFKIF